MQFLQGHNRTQKHATRHRVNQVRRIGLESLEPRLLLYAPNGGVWPHPELVTVSFMPDGTDIGGVASNLFSSMNARFPTATWQKEVLKGVQSFAAHTNLNVSLKSDDGSPFGSCGGSGTDCNLQGDSNFGDIRVGGLDLGGALGISMLPPPINGDTTAGDFFLDTTTTWNIGLTFDLNTVSAHEAGHSYGLDHSLLPVAVMFPTYLGLKLSLTADDIAGIQSIYGSRAEDSFDLASSNDTKNDASVITSYIDSNKQITLTNLDSTNSSDVDWYKVATPSGNSGTMVVQVQSTELSLLAPKLTVYKGTTQKGTVSGAYNSTVSISNSIGAGQNWFIKVEAAESTFGMGRYALQVNMGTASLPPVTSPNTATPVTGPGGNGSPILPVHTHDGDGHDHAVNDAAGDQAEPIVTLVTTNGAQNGPSPHGASDQNSESGDVSVTLVAREQSNEERHVVTAVQAEPVYCSTARAADSVAQYDLVDAVLPELMGW